MPQQQQPMQQQQPTQQQQPMQPQQQQQQQGIPLDVLANAQRASRDSQLKKNTTANITNQRQFASNLIKFGDPIEKKIPLVGKYFGVGGRVKLANDMRLAEKHQEPPELKIYKTLANEFKLYANEFGRAMGNNATNEQKTAMNKLVTPNWVLSNPDLALSVFKGLRSDEAKLDKSLSQSLSETEDVLTKQGAESDQTPQAQPSSSPSVSAAPAGTVDMINPKDGKVYHMKSDQAEDAIASAGWRRA